VRQVRIEAGGRLDPDKEARRVGDASDGGETAELLIRSLTDREREIVGHVAEGLTNEEIADRLTISPATVRTHVGRCMVKLRVRDRARLVVFAYRSGLVETG